LPPHPSLRSAGLSRGGKRRRASFDSNGTFFPGCWFHRRCGFSLEALTATGWWFPIGCSGLPRLGVCLTCVFYAFPKGNERLRKGWGSREPGSRREPSRFLLPHQLGVSILYAVALADSPGPRLSFFQYVSGNIHKTHKIEKINAVFWGLATDANPCRQPMCWKMIGRTYRSLQEK